MACMARAQDKKPSRAWEGFSVALFFFLGFALAVEGFELFQLFRALGEGLGALEEHGVPNVSLS